MGRNFHKKLCVRWQQNPCSLNMYMFIWCISKTIRLNIILLTLNVHGRTDFLGFLIIFWAWVHKTMRLKNKKQKTETKPCSYAQATWISHRFEKTLWANAVRPYAILDRILLRFFYVTSIYLVYLLLILFFSLLRCSVLLFFQFIYQEIFQLVRKKKKKCNQFYTWC